MTFNQKISAYTLGFLSDKDLPDIGLTGLEEGYDSPSLRMLAGYNQNDNPFQVYDTFKLSLSEINFMPADRKSSLMNVVSYYATLIANRTVDSYTGFESINELVRKTEFDYPDIYLEECYVDYITIWEVQGDGLQLHTGSGMSKEQYIDFTKNELTSHIQSWLTHKICVFKIKESFLITGRGIVVSGHVLVGILKLGAILTMIIDKKSTVAKISGIEIGNIDEAGNIPYGLLLSFEDELFCHFLEANKIQEQVVNIDFYSR